MLTGLLDLDSVAMAGCRVLLISGDMTRLLESTTTDDSGVFRFVSLPEPPESRVIVMAKIQGPVLSISYRIIDLPRHGLGPHRISIDSSGELFHFVQGRIDSNDGRPPYLLLHVDPVHLTGIPALLDKFFMTVDDQVIESSFYQQRIEGNSFRVRVQKGVYRMDVGYFIKSSPQLEEEQQYAMTQVTEEEGNPIQLTSPPYSSFVLDVHSDRSVRITIAPVKPENE